MATGSICLPAWRLPGSSRGLAGSLHVANLNREKAAKRSRGSSEPTVQQRTERCLQTQQP